jgi:hypothetical protein
MDKFLNLGLWRRGGGREEVDERICRARSNQASQRRARERSPSPCEEHPQSTARTAPLGYDCQITQYSGTSTLTRCRI